MQPDKNVLPTTQLLRGPAPAVDHHRHWSHIHFSHTRSIYWSSAKENFHPLKSEKSLKARKECERKNLERCRWCSARLAAQPGHPSNPPRKKPKIPVNPHFHSNPLENSPFLLVELSQLSDEVLLLLAIDRRLFVQYFRHFEALPLSHNVHSIFRQNKGNLWVQGVWAPRAALDEAVEVVRRLVVVRHRRGGWQSSAPRTSTSSLVRGCPTDASGKARQSTGQYGTSTHTNSDLK